MKFYAINFSVYCRPHSVGSVARKAPVVAQSHSASGLRNCTNPTKHVLLMASQQKSNV